MRRQRNTFQTKEQGKTLEKELNETEINNLSDKGFRVIAVKMLTDLWRRMGKLCENFSEEI